MSDLKQYKIEIFGLSNNTHQFNFNFDDDFFATFENSPVSKGKGVCTIDLTKTNLVITLVFQINGIIELECDRSCKFYNYPISIWKQVVYKYGNEEKELSENAFLILKRTQEINIANFLYESINLEVPMKKLHPEFQNDEETDEIIYTSKEFNKDKEDKKGIFDPRWEALKKLK